MSSLVKQPLLALAAAALALCTVSAHALTVTGASQHFLGADTSVSESVEQLAETADNAPFANELISQGLGPQGAISRASASQDVQFDSQQGASGFVESSVSLGAGISGDARSLLTWRFDLTDQSHFALDGFAELVGNASARRRINLLRDVDGIDHLEIFDFDLSGSTFSLAGLLDPGRYFFNVFNNIRSADPGESGRNRIDFDLRFDAVPGGNNVPEPGSLALAAAALGLLARVRRGRGA
jgi:hypothetical protein